MSDASDRVAARAELLLHAQPDVDPVLTSSGNGNEIDTILDRHKVASTWRPNTFYAAGDVVLPTVRNRRRYRCETAGVSDNSQQTTVRRIDVSAGGSGYTSAPDVAITGGGGSDAAAVAIISGGEVVGFFITNQGGGYTSAPAVSVTGGGGSGATAVASLNGIEPDWPPRDGARVRDGDGTTLVWVEDGPDLGNVYDVRAAAEEAWWLKARKASDRIALKMGDHSMQEQQTYERCV